MLVRLKDSFMLNSWEDTPENRERVIKWNMLEYKGETERDERGRLFVKGHLPTPSKTSYQDKRLNSYPSIIDQLDMLYWDKMNGTSCWMDMITQIKKKYPKEN